MRTSSPDILLSDNRELLRRDAVSRTELARGTTSGERFVLRSIAPGPWMTGSERLALQLAVKRGASAFEGFEHPALEPFASIEEREQTLTLVRRHVAGQTLAERLSEVGRMTLWDAICLLRELGPLVDALRGARLCHGAIGPRNIVLGEDGRAHVTDQAIARSIASFGLAGRKCRTEGAIRHRDDMAALADTLHLGLTGSSALDRGDRQADVPEAALYALRTAAHHGRNTFFTSEELLRALEQPTRPTIWQFALRPSAAAAVLATVATLPGAAFTDPPEPRHTKPAAETLQVAPALPTLPPEERDALRDAVGRLGAAALGKTCVADVVQLTQEQRAEVEQVLAAHRARVERAVEAAALGRETETGPVLRLAREEANRRILALLSPSQRAAWQELVDEAAAF